MSIVRVRVWLPDRPGALGAVAARIGAVQGDVVGIEILERGAGRAIDELVVDLPDVDTIPLLVREINEVDGVDVEEVWTVDDRSVDPALDALEAAAHLMGAADAEDLVAALCESAWRVSGATWAAVVDLADESLLSGRGEVPPTPWLVAFMAGSQASALLGSLSEPVADVTWAPLSAARLALMLGRSGIGFRARERRQVAALARIADGWLTADRTRSQLAARLCHPSRSVCDHAVS